MAGQYNTTIVRHVQGLVGIDQHRQRLVLHFDEIHRVPSAVEEYLYSAMEDFSIDFTLNEGPHARVEVNFETAGTKWLVLSYANLDLM